MPIKGNQDVACFFVTKHSWKGKYVLMTYYNYCLLLYFFIFRYKRIFSVGTMGITTYNPTSLDVTNRWIYSDVIAITASRSPATEFQITMRKEKGKIDNMRFSTEHCIDLITQALKFRHHFAEKPKEILVKAPLVFIKHIV